MKAQMTTAWQLLKTTIKGWSDDDASRLAAAMAYYTVLSLAPLVVLAVFIAGLVFGDEAARGQVSTELARFVGPEAGKGIETVVEHAQAPELGTISSILGVCVLFFGASGVFKELQASLNRIWEVEPRPGRGLWGVLRERFFSFTMVLGVAFLLLVSLVVSAALSTVGNFFSSALPGGEALWQILNFVISLGVVAVLFALIFKVVPDVKIGWREVWPGALLTALLFALGKFGLGMYLGRASVASPYGAAGSMIVLVIWVYYATQILFFGAEFTQVYAAHRGVRIEPSKNAVPSSDAELPRKETQAPPKRPPQLRDTLVQPRRGTP